MKVEFLPVINWRKSSFSEEGGNNCVEVAADHNRIAIRESTRPKAIVTTDRRALRAFLLGVKSGTLDGHVTRCR
jgi:hypothetical protein